MKLKNNSKCHTNVTKGIFNCTTDLKWTFKSLSNPHLPHFCRETNISKKSLINGNDEKLSSLSVMVWKMFLQRKQFISASVFQFYASLTSYQNF